MAEDSALDLTLAREIAYRCLSDPIFFKWQRGEATEQDWLDAVQAVKDQYPDAEG